HRLMPDSRINRFFSMQIGTDLMEALIGYTDDGSEVLTKPFITFNVAQCKVAF
ncbi:unnamed protein product, partial [Ceratitis capitata]